MGFFQAKRLGPLGLNTFTKSLRIPSWRNQTGNSGAIAQTQRSLQSTTHLRTGNFTHLRTDTANNQATHWEITLIFINIRICGGVVWGGVGWDVNVPSHAHHNRDDARLQHACLITWCYAGTCSPTWCYAGRLHQAYLLDATPEHVILPDAVLQHARQRQSPAFTPTPSHMQCNVPATQYWSVLLQILAQSKSSAQARENPSAQGRKKSSAQASARPTFDVMAKR